ncbi:ATP synthase subunit I [Rubrivirga sp.]|uniref:ATP synthase subunit I n=1 Tax=Rubrivirga sp. TaxID=1885344 RepID=UPI003C741079
MTVPASLLIGALLGAANAVAAVWTARRAERLDSNRALHLVLGGMGIRLLVVLAAFAVVLVFVDVHRIAFVAGLGVTFVAGMAAEVLFLLSRPSSERPTADA